MGAHAGMDLVTDGLTLCLDAADKNSYPGSGTTWTDLSSEGNNGTLTNSPSFTTDKGGAINFDGSDDYVDCGADVHDFSSGDFTISAWVYHDREVSHAGIVGVRDGTGTEVQLYISNTTYKLRSWNGSTNVEATNVVPENTWTYVSLVQSSGNKKFYINGVLDNTVTQANGSATSATFKIGFTGNGSEYFKGKIVCIRLYGKELSQNEINHNFNAQRSRFGV